MVINFNLEGVNIMEIRINIFGYLRLFRNGAWKPQLCPYASSPEVNCGDWCPMFEEPEIRKNTGVRLQLCQVTLVAGPSDFEDLRPMAEKNSC